MNIEVKILEKFKDERQPVECWTRVMGYFRPVSYFNAGKKQEFKDRKWFCEGTINDNTTRNTNSK